MVELRRAYRGWFLKRLAWLIPGFSVCCLIGGQVLLDSADSAAASIPSLAIVAGTLLLFGTLFLLCLQVLRVASRGDRVKARTLRKVLGPYRELSMAGIAAVLSLAAIPLLFERPAPPRDVAVHHPTPGRHAVRTAPEATAIDATPQPPEEAPEPTAAPPTAPPAVPAPAPAPTLPERAPLPELPRLVDEPLFAPLPLTPPELPVQDAPAQTREDNTPPQRPEVTDFARSLAIPAPQPALDRRGQPFEEDPTSLPLPELTLDVTIVPRSESWKGTIYELSFDLPLNRNESLHLTYSAAALNNTKNDEDYEATMAWHRMTLSYELKLAGYTRHATFDLAVRLGSSIDVIADHASGVRIDPTPRISPWIGMEAAVWEQSGVGVIFQGGYSVATGVTGASSAVADLRLLLRYDVSESLSVYIGYRYTAVRLHSHEDGPELHEPFTGPLAGLSLRF
jgi:hypothetical protein